MSFAAVPVSTVESVERSLAVIAREDPEIRAFVHVGAGTARADALRARPGPLRGLTLGVKDILDTADLPTEYGSPIYAGHRPRSDAAAVALLRRAGAIVVGKTVTAELAWYTPGPTRNPRRLTHTPGGSSSGSAAAVAAGMVDLALGTQTTGSIIRPASFCGVYGYKPSFGLVPTAGAKQAAASLDTVGLFAADLARLERGRQILTGMPARPAATPIRFAFVPGEEWPRADADCQAVLTEAAAALGAPERDLPDAYRGLGEAADLVQLYEGARALLPERVHHARELSAGLLERLERGEKIATADYLETRRRAAHARRRAVLDELFGDANVLVTPAAVGEAPEGLSSTGDPRFCRMWTLLGLPCLSVPAGRGATGLPIGLQLVARPYADAELVLAAARVRLALGV